MLYLPIIFIVFCILLNFVIYTFKNKAFEEAKRLGHDIPENLMSSGYHFKYWRTINSIANKTESDNLKSWVETNRLLTSLWIVSCILFLFFGFIAIFSD